MSRRKASKKKKDDFYGILLIAFSICILTLGGYYLFTENQKFISRNKEDNCRKDGFVTKESVLLVDTTDSVNPTQYQTIKNKLADMLENAVLDERISVYTITENPLRNAPILVTCNPGDGSDKSQWTSNKRRLKENWDKKFKIKLETAITEILEADLTKQSPILDTIKSVGVYSFSSSKAEHKQLIIVSDLLHHTESFSHYRNPKIDFSKTEDSAFMSSMLSNLNGAEIEILYLTRPKDHSRQGRTHLLFWEKYFEKSNGVITRIVNVN
ncbi:hypothetical protein [Shewanella xiamenensis]|uniref:hypothetical protein n=1 Tax=Shewanella xiamenensis TaxID=332186 RepID=UPI00084972EF|nr:hypothetical protein [Shewanella xiamenensis]MDL3986887.1 hypothetical protein [Shewanella xiamenensis]